MWRFRLAVLKKKLSDTLGLEVQNPRNQKTYICETIQRMFVVERAVHLCAYDTLPHRTVLPPVAWD